MNFLSVFVLWLCAPAVRGWKPPTTQRTAVWVKVPRGGEGGGTKLPILEPSTMVKIFCSFYALNGALSLPAPESAKDFALQEGTSDYVVFENLGTVSLGYAALVYLTAFKTTMAAPKVIALSSLPCAYVSYKNMLKGLTAKLSGNKLQGPLMTAFMVACIWAILNDKGNAKHIATALAIPPIVIGLVSQFNLGAGMQLSGFGTSSLSDKKGRAIYVWFAALMTGWGTLALLRLHQQPAEAMNAIALAAMVETAFMVDCLFLRQWNVGVAPAASNYVFLGIPLVTAIVLWLR